MRSTGYKLKQLQYGVIYNASDRTIKRWMAENVPLDDPGQVRAHFMVHRDQIPEPIRSRTDAELIQAYSAATDPEKMRLDVQRELAHRITEGMDLLREARDLARKRWSDWPEVASRINAIMDKANELLPVLGVDEDTYDWDESLRPHHLAGEGLIHQWGTDLQLELAYTKRLVWMDAKAFDYEGKPLCSESTLPDGIIDPVVVPTQPSGNDTV